MLRSIESMPDTSRTWIYQADRKLSAAEQAFIIEKAKVFLRGWQAHGRSLNAGFEIAYDQFFVLALDEAEAVATGCSIDASVHLIKMFEQALRISFTNSGQVAFFINGEVKHVSFNKVKELVSSHNLTGDTKIFDNTISTLGQFRKQWLVPSKTTWAKRYF